MEWIKGFWYIILLGLVAAMFLFGRKTKKTSDTDIHSNNRHGPQTGEKAHKSGHGCCH